MQNTGSCLQYTVCISQGLAYNILCVYIYIYIYNFMNVLLRLKKIDPWLLKEKVQRVYLWGKEL